MSVISFSIDEQTKDELELFFEPWTVEGEGFDGGFDVGDLYYVAVDFAQFFVGSVEMPNGGAQAAAQF